MLPEVTGSYRSYRTDLAGRRGATASAGPRRSFPARDLAALPDDEDIDEAALTTAISSTDASSLLRCCYELLIAPFANVIAAESSLIIVPDRDLFALPFAALLDGDGKRLVEKHALRVVREVLAHEDATAAAATREATLRERLRAAWDRFATGRRPRRAREATDVGAALEFLMQVTKRRTICFVVSDFLDDGFEQAMVTANRRHDVIAVLVTDPNELEVPDAGLVALEDAETGETRVVDTGSAAFRREVDTGACERVQSLASKFASLGIDFIHVDAAGDVVDPLVRFFRMRERRGRR